MSANLKVLILPPDPNDPQWATNPLPRIVSPSLAEGDCTIDQGWSDGAGNRRMLQFNIWIENHGSAPWMSKDPATNPECYDATECFNKLFSLKDFLEVKLTTPAGEDTRTWYRGHPGTFNVYRLPGSDTPSGIYSPGYGITNGWGHVLKPALPITWYDVTDVPNGDYWLKVSLDQKSIHGIADFQEPAKIFININYHDLTVLPTPEPPDVVDPVVPRATMAKLERSNKLLEEAIAELNQLNNPS